jgi:hypothetical protein
MKFGGGTGKSVCPYGRMGPGVGTMAAATKASKGALLTGTDPWTAVVKDGRVPLWVLLIISHITTFIVKSLDMVNMTWQG